MIIQYVHVQVEDCKEIVRAYCYGRRAGRADCFIVIMIQACPHPSDIPFLNQQTRIVLENCGNIDAESIDEYIAAGGIPGYGKSIL